MLLPEISVIILAYNHEKFIAKAVDSVLAQKIGIPYEVIISEDNSS